LPGSIFMSTLKLGPPLPAMVAPAAGIAEARAERRQRHIDVVRRGGAAVPFGLFVDVLDWPYHGPDRGQGGAPPRS
jgi:hypothetical protein